MPPEIRRIVLIAAALVTLGLLGWASRFDAMTPAQFSFQNGTDPKTLDPHRATGQPESRILFNIFAGLLQSLPAGPPDPVTGIQPMTPQPSIAHRYDVSDDGRTYTFHLRDDAMWSDGVPITSQDFVWSWTRMLHPETGCEYTFQLFSVPWARQYSSGEVAVGDRVEVELWDRPGDSIDGDGSLQNFPRGTMRYGTLRQILKPPQPDPIPGQSQTERDDALAAWQSTWVYVIDVATVTADGVVAWDDVRHSGATFCNRPAASSVADETTLRAHNVLVAFDKLGGLETPDPLTFIVHLQDPLPYFTDLVAYYPLFAVPRHVIQRHGMPDWTRDDHIVCNGPYKVRGRLLRDRIRLVKNDKHFAADSVSLETIDAISIESANTALNMYETGQLQWINDPPGPLIDELKRRDDFHVAPMLSVYFFRVNTTRPPLNDARVRRAIAMAINRAPIVDKITRAGQIPAFSLVPPGMTGYQGAEGIAFDIERAKALLSEAGYPGGRGFPRVSLLYNTQEVHRAIAEVVQQQLLNALNIKIELQNMEWGSYIDKVRQLDYDIARAGWIGDYPDPNTFLDLWIGGGDQNNTGWSDPRFDALIRAAAAQADPAKRMGLLAEAEQIWVDEMPVIPMFFYVSKNLVKPGIEGLHPTLQDVHPLHLIRYGDTRSPPEAIR